MEADGSAAVNEDDELCDAAGSARGEEKADEYVLLKCRKVPLPDGNKEALWYNFADVYGFRPPVNALLCLSPWEFVAHWTIVPLLPPWDDKYDYTRWKPPFRTGQLGHTSV